MKSAMPGHLCGINRKVCKLVHVTKPQETSEARPFVCYRIMCRLVQLALHQEISEAKPSVWYKKVCLLVHVTKPQETSEARPYICVVQDNVQGSSTSLTPGNK